MLRELYAHLSGQPLPPPEQAALTGGSGLGRMGTLRASQDLAGLLGGGGDGGGTNSLAGAGSGGSPGPASQASMAAPSTSSLSTWFLGFGAGSKSTVSAGGAGSQRHAAAVHAEAAVDAATGAGVVGDLRPHVITHLSTEGVRTPTLMKESLLGFQPAKDRLWVKAFADTTMFEVSGEDQ